MLTMHNRMTILSLSISNRSVFRLVFMKTIAQVLHVIQLTMMRTREMILTRRRSKNKNESDMFQLHQDLYFVNQIKISRVQ